MEEETRTKGAERGGVERRRGRSSSRRSLGEEIFRPSFSTDLLFFFFLPSESESSSRVRTRPCFYLRRVMFLRKREVEVERQRERGSRETEKNEKKTMLIFTFLSFLLSPLASLSFLWKSAMLLPSSLSGAASLSTPRLAAAAGPRRDGVVVTVSSMPPLLSSPLLPTPHSSSSSRPQLRSRCASSRRAPVTAWSSRSDGYGDIRGVTARWCLDAR